MVLTPRRSLAYLTINASIMYRSRGRLFRPIHDRDRSSVCIVGSILQCKPPPRTPLWMIVDRMARRALHTSTAVANSLVCTLSRSTFPGPLHIPEHHATTLHMSCSPTCCVLNARHCHGDIIQGILSRGHGKSRQASGNPSCEHKPSSYQPGLFTHHQLLAPGDELLRTPVPPSDDPSSVHPQRPQINSHPGNHLWHSQRPFRPTSNHKPFSRPLRHPWPSSACHPLELPQPFDFRPC